MAAITIPASPVPHRDVDVVGVTLVPVDADSSPGPPSRRPKLVPAASIVSPAFRSDQVAVQVPRASGDVPLLDRRAVAALGDGRHRWIGFGLL